MSLKENMLGLFGRVTQKREERAEQIAKNLSIRSQLMLDLDTEARLNKPSTAIESVKQHISDGTIAVHAMEEPHIDEEDTIFGQVVSHENEEAKVVLLVNPDVYSELPDQTRRIAVGKLSERILQGIKRFESRGKSLAETDNRESYNLVRSTKAPVRTISLSDLMRV